MRIKKLFLNCALLCGSTLFVFLLLEFFLRILPISNRVYYLRLVWNHWEDPKMPKWYNELYEYDETLGYERKEIHREMKRIIQDSSSSYKILVLGDSVTQWGKYVDYFKDLLINRYKNKDIEVVNAGVMGYDTELEYRYLKHRGLKLNPDLVLVQFCPNDFGGTPVIIKKSDGSWLALDGRRRLSKLINPHLLVRSRLYEFVALRLLSISKKKKGVLRDNVKEPLRRIKQLLEKEGIPFYFIVFPLLEESGYGRITYQTVMGIVKELDLSTHTIDLFPYYSHFDFEMIKDDPFHPNQKGQRIVAIVLMEKLKAFLDKQFN